MGLVRHQFYYKDTGTNSGSYTYSCYPDYPNPGIGGIQTTGTSTTINATTAAQAPFAPVNVGAILTISPGLGADAQLTKVATWTSPILIVAADAQNLAVPTAAWGYWNKQSGQAATNGAHLFNKWRTKTFVLNINTLGSVSLDFQIEGKSGLALDNAWTIIYGPQNYTATGTYTFPIMEDFNCIRVGEKANTPGTDSFDCYMEGFEWTT